MGKATPGGNLSPGGGIIPGIPGGGARKTGAPGTKIYKKIADIKTLI